MRRAGFVLAAAAAMLAVGSRASADLDHPTEAQKQAIYAKPSVVRVLGFWEITFRAGNRPYTEYVGGMGSGFFISADGFVATNAHVVQDIKNGEAAAKQQALRAALRKIEKDFAGEISRLTRDQAIQVLAGIERSARVTRNSLIVLPDGTKLPYEIRAYGAPVGQGKDVAIIKVDIKDAPNLAIGDSDRASIQDKVLAIGYPGAADMKGLFDSKSQLEATITDGAVSAIKRTTDGEPILQVSASITHGNSGGPAINLDGEVIGLTTFGSKGEVQGINFLVASSTLKKFVKEAKANTEPSKTIKVWRKALDEMWAGELDAAIADFDEVLMLYPAHSEAPRLVRHVRQLKKEGKGKKPDDEASEDKGGGGSSGAGIAVAIVIVVLLVIGVAIVIVRSKKRPGAPHAMPGHAPHPPHGGYGAPAPHMPPPGAPYQGAMVAGHAGPAPVAKTVAIGQAKPAQVAATAFGSLAMGSLTCVRGPLTGQRFSITPTGILIGRQPGVAHIVVNDSRASGKHVWIGFENGMMVAIDQGTTNGTFINDVRNGRISKAPLKDGDTVIVAEPDCLSLQLKLS